MPDLYSIETKVDPRSWQRFCGGNTGDSGTDESCVEFAPVLMQPDTYAVRDTKSPDRQPLLFTESELNTFAEGWMNRANG